MRHRGDTATTAFRKDLAIRRGTSQPWGPVIDICLRFMPDQFFLKAKKNRDCGAYLGSLVRLPAGPSACAHSSGSSVTLDPSINTVLKEKESALTIKTLWPSD